MPRKMKELPTNIVNPFSEEFLTTWQLWKDYRWEEHKFKYKGVISEQARLMQLVTLSGGDEDIAKKIVMQSIENTWTGFYMLKKTSDGNSKEKFSRGGVNNVLATRTYK